MPQDMTIEQFRQIVTDVEAELVGAVVGQRDTIRYLLVSLLAGGHVLLESVPGLGKTLLMRSLAQLLDLSFARLELTPDLKPENVAIGSVPSPDSSSRGRARFLTGTLFTNLVLADEINRAAPRTQSMLLEAMEQRTVSMGQRTWPLPQPFFVVASQNPFETEDIHSLSQAQVDRFLFKLDVTFPEGTELAEILDRTIAQEPAQIRAVADGPTILRMIELARDVTIPDAVRDHATHLLLATHPDQPTAPEAVRRHALRGAGPRGAQAMILGARVVALLEGRSQATFQDLRALAIPSLRHRIVIEPQSRTEGTTPDTIVEAALEAVPAVQAEPSLE